jgi:hypothetical protein
MNDQLYALENFEVLGGIQNRWFEFSIEPSEFKIVFVKPTFHGVDFAVLGLNTPPDCLELNGYLSREYEMEKGLIWHILKEKEEMKDENLFT